MVIAFCSSKVLSDVLCRPLRWQNVYTHDIIMQINYHSHR